MSPQLDQLLRDPARLRERLGQRPFTDHDEPSFRSAAVLMLLWWQEDEPYLWFIQRSGELRQHAGQIAFPGGKAEPQDPDLWHTALREAKEEIGVDPSQVEPLGRLDECWTPSGYRIRPYLGWQLSPFAPVASSEVQCAFLVPLRELLAAQTSDPWPRYPTPYGDIWGATARMLHQWLEWLND